MNQFRKWHIETKCLKVVESLKKNGFESEYFENSGEAVSKILTFIEKDYKIGIGGSVTINEIGLKDKILEKGGILLDHSKQGLTENEKMEVLRSQLVSDVFITSSNAITLSGEIVNIDGVGNRVASMIFGPKRIIIIVGENKICKDIDSAFKRIETVASPMNTRRLNKKTPCATTGICADCDSPDRICRVYTVIKRKPTRSNYFIAVVGEALGF